MVAAVARAMEGVFRWNQAAVVRRNGRAVDGREERHTAEGNGSDTETMRHLVRRVRPRDARKKISTNWTGGDPEGDLRATQRSADGEGGGGRCRGGCDSAWRRISMRPGRGPA